MDALNRLQPISAGMKRSLDKPMPPTAAPRSLHYSQLGILAAAVVLLVIFAAAVRTVREFQGASEEVLHAQEVRLRMSGAVARLKEINTSARAYLVNGDEKLLAARAQSMTEFGTDIARLRELTAAYPAEQSALQMLDERARQLNAVLDSYFELRRSRGVAAVQIRAAGDREFKRLTEHLRIAYVVLDSSEKRKIETLMANVRDNAQLTSGILVGGLALAVGLVIAVVMTLRREFKRREQAARLLAEGRRYAESIVDTVREPLVILTHDLKVNSANRPFYDTFRVTPEEAIGRPMAEISGGVWAMPELQEALSVIVPKHEELKDFKVTVEFPGMGQKVMLLNARKLYRVGNGTTMLLLAIEDITERERFETMLKHERDLLGELMDNATECIYFKDTECRFTRINRGLASRFGLANPADAEGKTDFDFYTKEHAQPTLEDEQAVMRSGQPMTKEEKETWPDGHVSWVLTVKLPLHDAAGKVVGTYGLSRDITERKQAEARLEELNAALSARGAELEAANRELEAFSYSVSHDLRAPLRHIDYFAAALEKQLPPEQLDAKARRHLTAISSSARGMGQLIDDLLSFARISRTELKKSRVRLDELVRETRQSLTRETDGRAIDWEVAPLPEVEGDPSLLRQVFANLLSNAVKYSRQRNPARIEIGPERQENGTVTLRVRDNGAGFDMKYADKLFGVFQRLHSNKEFEGTGVGLANVRRIVERHGGRIWAEAEVDRGATFYFTLPTTSNHKNGS
jgi:PAS domain S-box-containing protein